MINPRVLFIPVSTPKGIGEYMRSNIIATYTAQMNPELDIHFVLNKHVSYSNDCSFQTHFVSDTPTKCTEEVIRVIDSLKPEVIVFDASGRAEQFKYASRMGAKVIFISQHPKKRSKGLSLNRLPYIDKHWVAQPSFTMTDLSYWEKFKIFLYKKPMPEYLGCFYMPTSSEQKKSVFDKFGLVEKEYILFNSGSGGHTFNGELAADIYAGLAKKVVENLGVVVVVLYGASYPQPVPQSNDKRVNISNVENSEFISLLSGSKMSVLSGGGSILQAISLGVPCLAASVAKDQPKRINACAKENLLVRSELDVNKMFLEVQKLLSNNELHKLNCRLNGSNLKNGIKKAEKSIMSLVTDF